MLITNKCLTIITSNVIVKKMNKSVCKIKEILFLDFKFQFLPSALFFAISDY